MTPQRPLAWACALFVVGSLILSSKAQTLDHFDFSTITSPRGAYAPFRIIITARSSTGATVRTFAGTVQLTANSAAGPLPVEAFTTLKFTSGQWVGNVAVNEGGSDVTLQVRDPSTGRIGTSALFQVDPANFRVLDIPVLSMASDRTRGVLYGSVGPTNGSFGAVYVIEPYGGNILEAHNIPGGVGRIEMSPDASKLYVVSDDESRVRRLALPDFTEEAVLDLGESEPGLLNRADDLAVHPTNPNIIAITKKRRGISPRFTGVSVFDDTFEKKPVSAFFEEVNAVAWGAQPNRLYGLDNETTPSTFVQADVLAAELSMVANRRNILNPFNGRIQFVDGRLYSATGRIIDPESFTIFGEFANWDRDALILPIPDRKRIMYFTPASLGFMITYDSETLQAIGTEFFPAPRGYGSGVAYWGENGVALHDGKRLFLIENRLIPIGPETDVAVTAVMNQGEVVPVGVEKELQATVQNLGPHNAGPLFVKVEGTTDTVLTGGSVVGANGVVTVQERKVTYEVESLPAGSSITVRFTAKSKVEAWEFFSVVAMPIGVDPVSTNNSAGVMLKAAGLPTLDTPTLVRLANVATASDRVHGTVLVAPSTGIAPWANSVLAINPTSGEVTQPALVGPRPSQLAVSDDGKYLYVGFAGVPEVRRFLLPSLKYDMTIQLRGDGFTGPWFAGQMESRPGHSEDIAITRFNGNAANSSASLSGFFRNGVEVTPDRSSPELVTFAGPDRILAHEDGWGIFRFDVSDAGLTWNTILRDVEPNGDVPMVYDNGKLYFADGQVFDAEAGTKTGTFFVFGPYFVAPIVDGPSGRALFHQWLSTNQVIAAFDLTSRALVASNAVPVAPVTLGSINSLSRWSADGLVFSGSTGIELMKTDLISAGPPELRMDSVSIVGSTLTIRFSNLAPGQYVIEQCGDLGGAWSQAGNPFSETATEVPLSTSETRKFYRLVKLQ